MVKLVYAIHDSTFGHLDPFIDFSDACAIRSFSIAVTSAPVDNPMGFRPQDFELFFIGEYDTSSARFKNMRHRSLCSGDDAVVSDMREKMMRIYSESVSRPLDVDKVENDFDEVLKAGESSHA